jgi:hypothetical protein
MRGSIAGSLGLALAVLIGCTILPYPQTLALAESSATQSDRLQPWDVKCVDRGCLMFTDVLVADSGHPPDVEDPQYVTITVAIDQSTRKVAFFSFGASVKADARQGMFITFSKTMPDGDKWKMVLDAHPARAPFAECNSTACTARVVNGIVRNDGQGIDLLEKFMNSDHVLFLYVRDGQAYRAMAPLNSFKKRYRILMETELKSR